MNDRRRGRAAGVAALLLAAYQLACITGPDDPSPDPQTVRLSARPGAASDPLPPGKHLLGLGVARDGFLYVPQGNDPDAPSPLIVLLHGATGQADNWEGAFPIADSLGVVLLVPDSRGQTWDAIRGTFGPDVAFIDEALKTTFRAASIDPAHIAFSGFSDGATYALSVGLANGDLVTHILAFSPGFIAPAPRQGRPLVFVSHGTEDRILPISQTSRWIVPELESAGYSVWYEEFQGPHELPREIAEVAFRWFVGP
jgi:predicted esterase